MADEPIPTPESLAEAAADADEPGRIAKAASIAATLLRHKELVVAAMEALREKKVLDEEQEVKIVAAYEQGSTAARSAIHDLLDKLQQSNLGKVVVDLSKNLEGKDLSATGIRSTAQPYIDAAKQTFNAEARPYIERAKARLLELKAVEEPTLARLEAISSHFKDASKEIGKGIQGMGKEAADELVRRGKRLWMSPETEELEREFFDFVLKNLPKAEQAFVRTLLGMGLLLLLTGVLVAAREFDVMKQVAVFLSIFLLIFLGLAFLNWGIKLGEMIKLHKSDIERLARMNPNERRLFLTQRWAKRAQEEGLITSNEAQTVIMQTIHAMPEERSAGAPTNPGAEPPPGA